MLEMLSGRFKTSYESGAAASYLVIKADASEKLVGYQVEMLANNSIKGILLLDVRQKNGECSFYNNITSKLSLSSFLPRRKLLRNEFITIIGGITSTFLECKNYLLSENSLILHEDYIYINPATLEVALIYLPVVFNSDTVSSFKQFLIKLIVYSANIEEAGSDNFMQRILAYAKQETFSIIGFDRFLKALQEDTNAGDDILTDKENSEELSPEIIKSNNKQGTGDKGLEKSKTQYRPGPVIIAVLSQAAIAAGVVASWEYIMAAGNDVITSAAGVAVIILGVDYFLFKKLFEKDVKSGIRNNNKVFDIASAHMKESGSIRAFASDDMAEVKEGGMERPRQINIYETAILGYADNKETYLEGNIDGIREKIPVNKPSFLIGRLKEQVDYVSHNNAVGKIHAEILYKENSYFLKDLNSKNGTFLNDARVESNREYKLNNGDKIVIANTDFTFVTRKSSSG